MDEDEDEDFMKIFFFLILRCFNKAEWTKKN